MQLLMYDVNHGDVPPRLRELALGEDDVGRRELRGKSSSQVRRTTKDPPLLNALRATWNSLSNMQRQESMREQLRDELRDLALETYTKISCDIEECWDCQHEGRNRRN